jgi:hypothetical protein
MFAKWGLDLPVVPNNVALSLPIMSLSLPQISSALVWLTLSATS